MVRRRIGLIILVVIAVCTLGGAAGLWFVALAGREFEPAAWQADLEERRGVRLAMARRLIHDGALIGKTRPEVVGATDKKGYAAVERD